MGAHAVCPHEGPPPRLPPSLEYLPTVGHTPAMKRTLPRPAYWAAAAALLAPVACRSAVAAPAATPAITPAATPAPVALPPVLPAGDRPVVVMISLDGLAGYYLDDPKAEVPTLRALAAEGARASSMRASTPTVTWPTHTALVTGDEPARHGVVGNNYFDRATGKKVVLIADPVLDKDQIVKVPTIYDAAKAAGMGTAAIRWPATRGAKSLDWTIPDVGIADLLERYTTPALMNECKAAGYWVGEGSDEPGGRVKKIGDAMCTKVFLHVLRTRRPQLGLLHLVDVDHTEHLKGPRSPEAYEAVKRVDGYVREVWDALRADYPGRASLVIVSDHGFSPIERVVLPNVILRDAGLLEVKGQRVVGGRVQVVAQGGSAFVYATGDPADRPPVVAKAKAAFAGVKGVTRAVTADGFAAMGVADPKVDPHAPDLILFADEGVSFGDTAAGAMTFQDKPERKGTHGHDRELPDLHATFVAWGRGIKPGAKLGEVRNTDVAPTLAALLGIEFPGTDGKPMADALAK